MAIAPLDAASVTPTIAGGATTITKTGYVLSSGVDRVVVVGIAARLPTSGIVSVTAGGVPLGLAGSNAFLDMMCAVYVLAAYTPGTATIVSTFSSGRRGSMVVLTLTGVDQTTIFRTGAGGSNVLSTGAMTTAVGDYLLAAAGQNSGYPTVPAGWTDLGGATVDTTTYADFASLVASGTSTTAAFGGTNGDWAGVFAVPFIPSTGGGGGTKGPPTIPGFYRPRILKPRIRRF